MPEAKTFALDVEIDPAGRAASLRLTDDAEKVIGAHELRLESQPASMWEALFDTPAYLLRTRLREPADDGGPPGASAATESIEQLGVFIGRQLLGAPIMTALASGDDRRSLLVRVATKNGDASAPIEPLTSAFARIPWHVARPALGAKPLALRNLVVRSAIAGHEGAAARPAALRREKGEPLRVLCVFVEAPGARPLTARLERERLRDLFYDEIMPDNQVMLDVICHGATSDVLRGKLRDAGGYHVIHWSGHGHAARSAPSAAGTHADAIEASLAGADLVELLAEAGGFLPELVFLSASNAEPIGPVDGWPSLKAALLDPRGRGAARSDSDSEGHAQRLDALLAKRGGAGQTALSLLAAGVPTVALTRHAVSGAYARRLARRFYRSLLAAVNPQPADGALALAQRDLFGDSRVSDYQASDYASAVVLGERPARFELERGQSPDLVVRRPQPQPLLRGRADLEPPRVFAGRGAELAQLAAAWLPKRGAAVALVHGPAGVGKTAFAAEVVHLWHRQFHWVMAFQARKPGLALDDFYRELDKRLTRASPAYRERCRENEERRVYLPPRQDLSGTERYELLRDNVIDVLGTASILLVIDGFEENLGSVPVEEGYASSDPEWDALLRALVFGLADVTGSRVLITSRAPLAALPSSTEVATLKLGPLLANEALSIVEESEALRAFVRGGLPERELAWRVLETSAGHPPALQRLGDLAREGRALLESGVGVRSSGASSTSSSSLRAIDPSLAEPGAENVERAPLSIRASPISKRPVISYAVTPEQEAAPMMPAIPPAPPLPFDLQPPEPAPPPHGGAPPFPSPALAPPPHGGPPPAAVHDEVPAPGTLRPPTPPPGSKDDAPMAVGSPDKVAQRAVSLLIERLSPAERSLLWRLTRAPAPAPLELALRIAEIAP